MDDAVRDISDTVEIGLSQTERVSPVMVASCARSGKTTTLARSFNALRELYCPIFLSFNGDSGFQRRVDENDIDAFCRTLASQLLGDNSNLLVCPKDTLENYLKTATKPIASCWLTSRTR